MGEQHSVPTRGTTRRELLAAAALFVLSLAYFGILAPYGLELADEGHLLHQIYRTAIGQLPYVDFHTGYSPGVYYLNAWLLNGFQSNLVVVRLTLAGVNTLCVLCMWWLASRMGASPLAAWLTGLAYIAIIPFFDGSFAPFNIPYPAWYVTLFWLLAVIAVVRWWQRGNVAWWFVAGLLAGLVFSFKQNSGLLALANCLIAAALLQRPPPASGVLGRSERLLRWLVPAILTLGFFKLFGAFATGSPAVFLVAPLATVLIVFFWHGEWSPAHDVRRGTLFASLVLLGAGFALTTLPWLIYFWGKLGTAALLRAVFYIGTPYEQYYLIPYPALGRWGKMAALAAIAVAALPMLCRFLRLRLRVALAIAAGVGLAAGIAMIVAPPQMAEGFQASVVMRMRDVSFAIGGVLLWGGVLAFFLRARRAHRPSATGVHLILVVSAVLMHMQIYPRSDYMHLVYAAPGALIIGAWLLDRWAMGLARALGISPGQRLFATAVFQAPAFLIAAVLLSPALLRIDYLVRAWASGDANALVRLETPRAPLVIEPSGGRLFRSLSQTIAFLDRNTQPRDPIFTFPCLDILTFLADRQEVTRHGYYYPGSPGHAVEAEVVDALEAAKPPYAVTLHDHALFFVSSPIYYFNLRDYVTEEYALDRRFGMFDVLTRRSAPPPPKSDPAIEAAPLREVMQTWIAELRHDRGHAAKRVAEQLEQTPPASPEDLGRMILSMTPRQQRVLADLIQKSRSGAGGAALAVALGAPDLPDAEFNLFVRIISAVADLRAVPPLLAALETVPKERVAWVSGNLFTIASRVWIENYFYAAKRGNGPAGLPPGVTTGQLINWLQNPWVNPGLRSFALRMAGRDRNPAIVPFLVRVATDPSEMIELRIDASHSLVQLGYGAYALETLALMFPADEYVSGALLAGLHTQEPARVRAIIAAYMVSPSADARRRAFWVAGALRDPELIPLLQQGLSDTVPEVRMAAAWALSRIGGEPARAALAQAPADAHDEVEAFFERAQRRVKE